MSDPKPITPFQMKLMKMVMGPFSRWNASRYMKSQGKSMGRLSGYDICVATMKGAKSGKVRHMPLMYVPYKDGVILVASLGGAPKNPTWYYNIVANPVEVHDLHATMLHQLGLHHEKLTYRYAGRDFRLTDVSGNVVKQLVAVDETT